MLLWHCSKAKRWAEALGLTFETHTLRIFESQISFTSLFKRKIRWAWCWISSISPADWTHLALSGSEGFCGGEWVCWECRLTGLLPGKKIKLSFSSTGTPTVEAAQEKQKAELIPLWIRHTFFFFFSNSLPIASTSLRKTRISWHSQWDRFRGDGHPCGAGHACVSGAALWATATSQSRPFPYLFPYTAKWKVHDIAFLSTGVLDCSLVFSLKVIWE